MLSWGVASKQQLYPGSDPAQRAHERFFPKGMRTPQAWNEAGLIRGNKLRGHDCMQKAAAMERCGLHAAPIIGSRLVRCRLRSGQTNSYCSNAPMTGRCWALREPTRDLPNLAPPELAWEPDWVQPSAVQPAA